jgi:2-polyprenyl-3-methyl-5-hydroxy-6-metoxy-1,4-benzoquinol methylase
MRYTFNEVKSCNMCGSGDFKILGKRMNKSQGIKPKSKVGISTTVVKCKKCSLIYSNPQPIPSDLQDHYGVPPETYWKEKYFEINPSYFAYEIEVLRQLLPYQTGQTALDIGAGLGKCMISLKNKGYDAYGFEPAKPFYERAISKMGIHADKLKLAAMEEVDYPENHFDFITFGAVLEHLYDPSAALAKAQRWLKPNGLIQIEVPSSNWLIAKIFNTYFKIIGTDYVTNLSPMHSPFHLYEFGLASFLENSKLNNYTIAKHEYFPCQTFMPKILDKPLTWYMKATNTGMQLSIWLRKK